MGLLSQRKTQGKALWIADYVVDRTLVEGHSLGTPHLMKILYLIQGRYLAHTNRPLFPERFEVWPSGPVLPHVYDAYRHLGAGGREGLRRNALPKRISKSEMAFVDGVFEQVMSTPHAEVYLHVMRTFGPASKIQSKSHWHRLQTFLRGRFCVSHSAIKAQFRLLREVHLIQR